MRLRYVPLAATVFGIVLVGSASSASADIETTNGCQGSGVWRESGIVVDAATATEVVTIPRSDTVDWQGSVSGPPGVYSGSIAVDLPPPFGVVEIDSWAGDSENTGNEGADEYDIPSLVPAGVEFELFGEHFDENGFCVGSVRFEIDGGVFSSPITIVSLVGTFGTGAGVALGLRPLYRRVI